MSIYWSRSRLCSWESLGYQKLQFRHIMMLGRYLENLEGISHGCVVMELGRYSRSNDAVTI